MSEQRYTKDHVWVRLEDGFAVIGISNHAQSALGDIVFVELPEPNRKLMAGDEAAVVESVKAATEVYSPLSGKVAEVNDALLENPALVNESAEEEGWFYKIRATDLAELDDLMDHEAYELYLEGIEEP